MAEEIIDCIESLPEKMDEIIIQFESDILAAGSLINNKKLYNDFSSALSELDELISETEKVHPENLQISLF